MQGDRLRFGGRGNGGVRRQIVGVDDGKNSDCVVFAQAEGHEAGHSLDRPTIVRDFGVRDFGDRGHGGFARHRLRRGAQARNDGIQLLGGGSRVIDAPLPQKFLGVKAKPFQARPIEENDCKILIQHVDRLPGRAEQFCQFGGRATMGGHENHRKMSWTFSLAWDYFTPG